MRQRRFSVCIFPFRLFFGLTGIENRRSQIARSPPLRVASYVSTYTKSMKQKSILIIFLLLTTSLTWGQSIKTDSCGIDTSAVLNEFEIHFIDSVFFASYETRKGELGSFTNGFNFHEKKIAFYDCSKTTENGYMTKKEFFEKVLPEYRGPHGLTVLKDNERNETSYDAIIVINCKMIVEGELVEKLKLTLKY